MLDIQFVRDNPELVKEKSQQKGYTVDIGRLLEADQERRKLMNEIEELRSNRNQLIAKSRGVQPSEKDIAEGREIRERLLRLEEEQKKVNEIYLALLKVVPNMPLEDVPVGASEHQNVVSKTVGEIPNLGFEPKDHASIAQQKGWLDKDRAAKVAGSRFAYIKGDMAKLQLAIAQFTINRLGSREFIRQVLDENQLSLSDKPFQLVLPPLLLKESVYEAMDRLEPKDERYQILGDENLWLQGSAEHVLGSMHIDEIIAEDELPLRYLGYATSFRREAGSYGKDTEGTFRLHQFDKLEMESLTLAENGLNEHLLLVALQEKLMQLLGLPYHVLMKCTADIGKPNARGVDIEAWLPSQKTYRETHTADYMSDYQSRRLRTRVKRRDGRIELVHTNDATAFALSRTPIAIIENYQTKEGNVSVPEVLRPFLDDRSEI